MKSLLLLLPLMALSLSGCSSMKEITLVDSNGIPLGDCLVLAVQSNMLYPNQKGFFKSNEFGNLSVPYSGLVVFYAGKPSYAVSLFSLVGEGKVEVPLFSPSQIEGKTISKSHVPLYQLPEDIQSKELQEWVKYTQATPVISVEPRDMTKKPCSK